MPESIDVVLGFDQAYQLPASVTIASLVAHVRSARVRVHIFHEDLATDVQVALAARARPQDDVIFYRVGGSARFDHLFRHSSVAYLNGSAMLRLHVDDLPTSITRVVYLDADVLVRDDISRLWHEDLAGRCVGAVEDPFVGDRRAVMRALADELLDGESGNPAGRHGSGQRMSRYFNSGVMLIDLEGWRSLRLSERCRDLFTMVRGYLNYPDQDVLNILLLENWAPLPKRWNTIVPYSEFDGMSERETRAQLDSAAVLHFAGNLKPWSGRYPDSWLGWIYRREAASLGVQLPSARQLSRTFTTTRASR